MSEKVLEPLRAWVGRTVNGKYLLDPLVGVGGMAAVYSATHRNGGRVTLKVLHAELSLGRDADPRLGRSHSLRGRRPGEDEALTSTLVDRCGPLRISTYIPSMVVRSTAALSNARNEISRHCSSGTLLELFANNPARSAQLCARSPHNPEQSTCDVNSGT